MLPVIFSFGPVVVHSFGVLVVLALVFGSFVFWRKAREENYDENEIFDLVLGASFWALIGGRIAYILTKFDDFGLNAIFWLSIWSKPGFYWPGIFLGLMIYTISFAKEKKWDILEVLDLAVIGASFAQALIHLGLFLSGSGVGKVTSLPVGIVFPGLFEKRHPVGLYGFILWCFGYVLIAWLENKYRRFEWYQKFKGDARSGFVTFSYAILAGVIRLMLSFVSEPNLVVSGIDMEIVMRLLLIVAGVIGIYRQSGLGTNIKWRGKKKVQKKEAAPEWKRRRKSI